MLSIFMSSLSVWALPKPPDDLKIDSEIALLVNLDTDKHEVLYSKNAAVKAAPASLTKIATAATAFANGVDLDAVTTVSSNAIHNLDGTGSAVAGLVAGEEVTIRQLMYLILLHSAGEACNVLAEYMAGSIEEYMNMVNSWIQQIGCTDTVFLNPVGLDQDGHYTTAEDLQKITLAALEYPEFKTIACTTTYEMAATNKSKERTFRHRNSMTNKATGYYYKYAQGIKTGTTKNAGNCVVTMASKDGYNYLAIVLKGIYIDHTNDGKADNGAFFDAKHLFEWAFSSFRFKNIVEETQIVCDIPLKSAKDTDKLQLVPEKTVSALVPMALDSSAVIIKPTSDISKAVNAPVKKGTVLGTAEVIFADDVIATINLVAADNVERSIPLFIYNSIKDIFSTLAAKIVLAVVAVLFLVYIVITILYNIKKKKMKFRDVTDRRDF